MRACWCLLPLTMFAAPALAQDHDPQLWLTAKAGIDLGDDLSLDLETAQRFSDDSGGLYESQYILALSKEVADGVILTGGINRVVGRSNGRTSSLEWRPRQQVGFPIATLGTGRLTGRVRLEQRFRSGEETGHRVRPQVRFQLPVANDGKTRFNLSHESYFNLNTTEFQRGGWERMRNAAYLSFPLGGPASMEVGYLNQFRVNRGAPDQMAHAATVSLSLSL